jgi:hypothetical protein
VQRMPTTAVCKPHFYYVRRPICFTDSTLFIGLVTTQIPWRSWAVLKPGHTSFCRLLSSRCASLSVSTVKRPHHQRTRLTLQLERAERRTRWGLQGRAEVAGPAAVHHRSGAFSNCVSSHLET